MNKNIHTEPSVCDDFQESISNSLIRNRSILDILGKLDQYNNRVTRSVFKAVTSCGCVNIDAKKQNFDQNSFENMINTVDSHFLGELCDDCKDIISEEIGSNLFYLAALCDTLGLRMEDIMDKEIERVKTLGVYALK